MKTSKKINKFNLQGRILWLYIKYQIISKLIVGILILPLFHFITQALINLSGRTNISSGDYIGFFTSLSGFPVILLGILVLVFVLGTDIIAFIILSALIKENKLKVKIKDIFFTVLKSLKVFFSPIGIVLVVFIAVILPLVDAGVTLGPLKDFAIPNFITSVIFANPLYFTLYIVVIVILTIISFFHIFTLHFVLIDNQKIGKALKSSRQLMKKYWKNFIIDNIWITIKLTFLCFIFGIIILGIFALFTWFLSFVYTDVEVLFLVLFFSAIELFALFVFFSAPIAISVITNVFYKYNAKEKKHMEIKIKKHSTGVDEEDLSRKIKVKTKLEVTFVLIVTFVCNFFFALVIKQALSEDFEININIELITHRGGGDLGAENTVDGIQKAIAENAAFTEIDVQRTKDGKYIINHDKSFKRVAGVDKKPSEMTLEEIKKLKVKNEFEPEKPSKEVPTLKEILDISKGKIGVFIELKGETADEKMVDDVVKMIKERDMIDETAILSLDYDIIKYTEKKYPEIETGFLYFFSVGKLKNLEGDYLIMEEAEATPGNIADIHASGKKAIVWTVNTPKSIEKFIYSDIDGIITDHIGAVKKAIENSKNKTQFEIMTDKILSGIGL